MVETSEQRSSNYSVSTEKFILSFSKLKADCAEFGLSAPKVITELVDDQTVKVSVDILFPGWINAANYSTEFPCSDINSLAYQQSVLCELVSKSIHYRCRLTEQERKDFISRTLTDEDKARSDKIKIHISD